MSRWTMQDVRAVQARRDIAPAQKYHNRITVVDGISFDSKKEANYYLLLKMRERQNEIHGLQLQPVFPIYVEAGDRGRISIGVFKADFSYWEDVDRIEHLRVIDVKSSATKTEAYRLRKKLVEAIYNITIIEV